MRRSLDLAARYGGEEFIVLMPNTLPEGALAVGERVRLAVRALNIPRLLHPAGQVTVSVGAASFDAEGLENLMSHADQALYRAKANGRDRVELALTACGSL